MGKFLRLTQVHKTSAKGIGAEVDQSLGIYQNIRYNYGQKLSRLADDSALIDIEETMTHTVEHSLNQRAVLGIETMTLFLKN